MRINVFRIVARFGFPNQRPVYMLYHPDVDEFGWLADESKATTFTETEAYAMAGRLRADPQLLQALKSNAQGSHDNRPAFFVTEFVETDRASIAASFVPD